MAYSHLCANQSWVSNRLRLIMSVTPSYTFLISLPPCELWEVSCKLNGQEYLAPVPTQRVKEGKEAAALQALKIVLGE